MEKETLACLTALGHAKRLGIFRLLMRRYPDAVPAGEISAALSLKPSTASVYLSALLDAELVSQQRQGTSLLYAIDMTAVRRLFDYLLLDCCRGRPDACPPLSLLSPSGASLMRTGKYSVLFLCTGNSARSIFAEAILRREAGYRFDAYSAGTNASAEVNPFVLDILRQKGYETAGLRAKSVTEISEPGAPRFDFVFTVCNPAANEECTAWEGQPISAHWGMPDPVKAVGTTAEKSLAFQEAYRVLSNRIKAFAALPIDTLNRISLQKAVDDLSRSMAGEHA
jgi:arsenate reductase